MRGTTSTIASTKGAGRYEGCCARARKVSASPRMAPCRLNCAIDKMVDFEVICTPPRRGRRRVPGSGSSHAPVQVHGVYLREQRGGHHLPHVRRRQGRQPRQRLAGQHPDGRIPVPELGLGEVVDQGVAVGREARDGEGDGGVGRVAVAQGEVVGGREDLDAVGEVLVTLPPHVLLEGRRGCGWGALVADHLM